MCILTESSCSNALLTERKQVIFYIGDILNYSDYESRGIIEDLYLLIIKV